MGIEGGGCGELSVFERDLFYYTRPLCVLVSLLSKERVHFLFAPPISPRPISVPLGVSVTSRFHRGRLVRCEGNTKVGSHPLLGSKRAIFKGCRVHRTSEKDGYS